VCELYKMKHLIVYVCCLLLLHVNAHNITAYLNASNTDVANCGLQFDTGCPSVDSLFNMLALQINNLTTEEEVNVTVYVPAGTFSMCNAVVDFSYVTHISFIGVDSMGTCKFAMRFAFG
jgi:hypothetical protein